MFPKNSVKPQNLQVSPFYIVLYKFLRLTQINISTNIHLHSASIRSPPTICQIEFHPNDVTNILHHRASEYIALSKTLDFMVSPRPNISSLSHGPIKVFKGKKRLSETMKWSMVAVASVLGSSNVSYKRRMEIFKAVVKVHSYLYGFMAPAIS